MGNVQNWSKKIGMMSQYNIMIDDSLSQTLFMDEKYDKTPADISVLTRPDNLRNHVKQDGEAVYGPKNFYLFLIDK